MGQYLKRIGIALSILINVLLGGYSNQTFSARNYMWKRAGLPNLVWLIDGIFNTVAFSVNKIFGTNYNFSNHCLESWAYWRVRKDVVFDIQQNRIKDVIYNGEGWKIKRFYFSRNPFKRI